jgi:hypothetical protein
MRQAAGGAARSRRPRTGRVASGSKRRYRHPFFFLFFTIYDLSCDVFDLCVMGICDVFFRTCDVIF